MDFEIRFMWTTLYLEHFDDIYEFIQATYAHEQKAHGIMQALPIGLDTMTNKKARFVTFLKRIS